MPLGLDSEGKEDYTEGDPPWRVNSSSHILGIQAWVQTQGRQVPLACWKAGGINRWAVGSLDSACEECVHTCLLLKQGGQDGFTLY